MATYTPGSIGYYTSQGMSLRAAQDAALAYKRGGNISEASGMSETPNYSTNVGGLNFTSNGVDEKSGTPEYTSTVQGATGGISNSSTLKTNAVDVNGQTIKSGLDKIISTPTINGSTSVGTKEQVDALKGPLTDNKGDAGINGAGETEEEKRKRLGLVDLSTKKGTYAWFLKQPGQTPESARKAAMAAMQKSGEKTPPITIEKTNATDALTNATPENIYDLGNAAKKEDIAKQKTAQGTIKSDSEKASEEIKTKEIESYTNMETSIKNERDTFTSKLNELQTGFEGNRLNQVRGQIIQGLQSRGVNVGQLSPEQLIQLSGDIGSKAFTDIHAQKVDTENKIKAARDLAVNALNDLLAKKTVSETNYIENINSINNSYTKNIADLNSAYTSFVLGTEEKQAADIKATTTSSLNLLENLGYPKDTWNLFAGIIEGAKTPEEAMRKIALAELTPEQQAAYKRGEEQRSATAKAEAELKGRQLDQELYLAKERLKIERDSNANSNITKNGTALLNAAEQYGKLAAVEPDATKREKLYAQQKYYLDAFNSGMAGGGTLTPSP